MDTCWRFVAQVIQEFDPLIIVLHSSFRHLYFGEKFSYWARDCDFELHLGWHAKGIFARWHKVELFTIPHLHCSAWRENAWLAGSVRRTWIDMCTYASAFCALTWVHNLSFCMSGSCFGASPYRSLLFAPWYVSLGLPVKGQISPCPPATMS